MLLYLFLASVNSNIINFYSGSAATATWESSARWRCETLVHSGYHPPGFHAALFAFTLR